MNKPKIGHNGIENNQQLKAAYRLAHHKVRALRREYGIPDARIDHILFGLYGQAMADCVMASYTAPEPVEFPAEDNDVVTQYVDGTLQVTVNKVLNKSQVKAYCTGARRIPGVKGCEFDNAAQFASGYTAFCIVFNPKYAKRLEDVRAAARDYTERFLKELQPTTVQAGLFDAVPTQTSLF